MLRIRRPVITVVERVVGVVSVRRDLLTRWLKQREVGTM